MGTLCTTRLDCKCDRCGYEVSIDNWSGFGLPDGWIEIKVAATTVNGFGSVPCKPEFEGSLCPVCKKEILSALKLAPKQGG